MLQVYHDMSKKWMKDCCNFYELESAEAIIGDLIFFILQ